MLTAAIPEQRFLAQHSLAAPRQARPDGSRSNSMPRVSPYNAAQICGATSYCFGSKWSLGGTIGSLDLIDFMVLAIVFVPGSLSRVTCFVAAI